jgi:hypothetical protein
MPKTSYEIAKVRHLFSYVYTFIVISYYRNGTLQNG